MKFRGVTIGLVSQIAIAPDRRHVDVAQDLEVAHLQRMGLSDGNGRPTRVPTDLRAQLAAGAAGAARFADLVDRFGVESVREGMRETLDYAERMLDERVAKELARIGKANAARAA